MLEFTIQSSGQIESTPEWHQLELALSNIPLDGTVELRLEQIGPQCPSCDFPDYWCRCNPRYNKPIDKNHLQVCITIPNLPVTTIGTHLIRQAHMIPEYADQKYTEYIYLKPAMMQMLKQEGWTFTRVEDLYDLLPCLFERTRDQREDEPILIEEKEESILTGLHTFKCCISNNDIPEELPALLEFLS